MFSKLITTAAVVLVVAVGTATAGTTPQGLKADGLRLQAMAERYQQMQHYTPQGLEADGLRWQAMARAYATRPPVVSASSGAGFDWGDAGIGAAGGLVLFVCGGVAVLFARRSRRAKLAV
jgi:hypothetical protein